jgi:predicted nuclease of predicted toxin-antitoxin system
MKLLLDERIPKKLKQSLVGYDCHTASESGLAGKNSDELLISAERAGFDVLVTTDKGLEHEQNFKDRRIAVLILLSKSNKLDDLAPLIAKSLHSLPFIKPGQILKVG